MNQASLVGAYQVQSRRGMVVWTIASYAIVSALHRFATSSQSGEGRMTDVAVPGRPGVSLLAFACGFFLLTMLVLRPAYLPRSHPRRPSQ